MRKLKVFFLLVALALSWALFSAQADFDLVEHYIDYEITLCVGDSVTLYKMPYANNGDHWAYDENGRPGRFVTATGEEGAIGLNAFDTEYTLEDIRYAGAYGFDLNYYNCNVTLTVTGKAFGSGVITFSDSQMALGKTGVTLQVPRITVHVVDSGPTFVSAMPKLSWTSWIETYAYKSPPSATRPNWTFDRWETEGEYLYAKWQPNFLITGNIPGGDLVDNLDDGAELTVNQAIIPSNNDSVHHDGFTIGFMLTNYFSMNNDIDGEPEWTVTQLDGPELSYDFQNWGQNSWGLRTDAGTPQERCSTRLQLICTWGGVSKSLIVTINYLPVSLPVGTDIPEVIDLQVGQTTDYTFHFLNNYSFENRIWYTGFINERWEDFNDLLTWSNDGNMIHLSPKGTEPGFYHGFLTIVDGNLAMNQEVIFRIADRDGSIPELVPDFGEETFDLNVLLRPTNSTGYDVSFPYGWSDIYLQNEDVLRKMLGDEYSIAFRQTSGPNLDLSVTLLDDHSLYLEYGQFDHLNDGDQTTVEVTVIWGGTQQTTLRLNLTFVRPVLPGITWDTFSVLQVGQVYEAHVLLSNQNWTDDYFLYYDFSDEGCFEKWGHEKTTFSIRPLQPGWYECWPHLHARNMMVRGERRVIAVADESGNIPDRELILNYEPNITMALFDDNDETGLHHQNYVTNVGISWNTYSVMMDAAEGEPIWSHHIEQEINDEIIYHVQDFSDQYNTGVEIFIDQYPTRACEANIHVNCSWGDYESEAVIHIDFIELSSLPTGMLLNGQSDLEDIYTVQGEECQIMVSWDPTEYSLTDRSWVDIDIHTDGEYWWDWTDGNRVQHIRCDNAGLYYVEISLNNANLRMSRGFLLHVADENGNVPETVPWFAYDDDCFEMDFMLGNLGTDSSSGWATVPLVFGWILDNLEELKNAYGLNPEIVWSYEYLSGPKAGLNIAPRNYTGIQGDGCGVYVTSMPESSGSMLFNLNCSWNGHVGSMPVKINFVEQSNNLASDTSFPTKLTLPVGESIRMMGFFTEEGEYDVPADYVIMDFAPNDCFAITKEDEVTFTLTGLNAGSITCMTAVGGYARAFFHKRMTINVVDTVITLPDHLKTIQAEAFAGVDNVVVYIPSSVELIEDDAFEPNVTVICPVDSYAFSRCEAMGLYVIGK